MSSDTGEHERLDWGFMPSNKTSDEASWEESIYREALNTNYRLENWPADDLWAYCGIIGGSE